MQVHYDPFRFMKDRGAVYGHVGTFYDNQCWTVGLWDAVADYWKKLGVKQKCDWPPNLAHYNNFEISNLEVWNSIEYRRYIDHVDRLGGIYYYRWGDPSIKSLFLSYMYHPRLIYQFRNIGYRHNINRIS
jgi:alpha 1,2-mannosyltransferase